MHVIYSGKRNFVRVRHTFKQIITSTSFRKLCHKAYMPHRSVKISSRMCMRRNDLFLMHSILDMIIIWCQPAIGWTSSRRSASPALTQWPLSNSWNKSVRVHKLRKAVRMVAKQKFLIIDWFSSHKRWSGHRSGLAQEPAPHRDLEVNLSQHVLTCIGGKHELGVSQCQIICTMEELVRRSIGPLRFLSVAEEILP